MIGFWRKVKGSRVILREALLFTSVACAQVPIHVDSRSTDELLETLKQDDEHAIGTAGFLLNRGDDPRTVPALRSSFKRLSSKESKQVTAMVLLRLGVMDQEYFDYLASFATEAIESEAPSILPSTLPPPVQLGQSGPRPKMNPEFEAWCLANGRNIDDEMRRQWIVYPNDVRWLASSLDPRAAPLFRKGLASSNGQIVIFSAFGLAEIGNLTDIPLLVQASYVGSATDGDTFARALAIYSTKGPAAREAVLGAVRGTRLYDAYVLAEKVRASRVPARK